jgi:ATP-dependent Zn protease
MSKAAELECTAYHEAGHAIARIVLRRRFIYVTIKPEKDRVGHLRHGRLRRPSDPACVNVDEVICALAGSVAEKLVKGRYNHRQADQDYLNALDWARRADKHGCGMPEGEPIVRGVLRAASQQAKVLLDRHRPELDAVARALLRNETLSYSEVDELVRTARVASN